MKRLSTRLSALTLATAILCSAFSPASAEPAANNLKVAGTWGYLNIWKEVEKPFWATTLKKATNGKLTVDAKPMTELGLKGFEVMRMLQLGIFDAAHGIISYLGEDTVAEGSDLAGIVQNWEQARAVVKAYRPILEERFAKSYDAKLVGIYPFPSQLLYCNKPVQSLADLKGKKVRSYSKSMSDLLKGLGATPVTIAFGEVVPALQLGTVDCAITGTLPAYASGWGKVTTHLVRLNTGYAFAYAAISNKTWARLDKETKTIISSNAGSMTERAWKIARRDDDLGVACLTDGKCTIGKNAKLKNVILNDADKKLLAKALQNSVLKSFAKRCDNNCITQWNKTIGAAANLKITK